MLVVFLIDLVVVVTLLRTGRRRLEDALPLFCFYLVLLPIESRFVVPGLFDLGSDRVAMVTLLMMFFLRKKERGDRGAIAMKNLIWLHVGWAICSTAFSISVATSAKQLIGQMVEYYLLYYVLLRLISEVRTIKNMLYAITLGMGLCCIFGLVEAYTSWSVLTIFPSNLWIVYGGPGPLYVEWGRGLRIRSTFPHPILLGDAIAMTIPIALYLLSESKQFLRRSALLTILFMMFWAIYKTSSRGPWLAVGFSFVLLFFLARNRIRQYLAAIALVTTIALLARPGVWQTIENLYVSTQDASSPVGSSYEYRTALLHSITVALAKEPAREMFGYGLGTFRERGLELDFIGEKHRWYTCDNNWALFLYETGYIGLGIIGVLLFTPLLMTLQSYRRLPRPAKHLSGVMFVSLAVFLLSLWSVAGYNWGQQGFMAWILIASSVTYGRVAERDQDKQIVARKKQAAREATFSTDHFSPALSS
jgi:hypothetical protein